MNAHTRLSAKGQLVVPKAVRDRLRWSPGDTLELVEHDGAITLRAVPKAATGPSVEEVIARLRKILPYNGPRISEEDIHEAVRDMVNRDGVYGP